MENIPSKESPSTAGSKSPASSDDDDPPSNRAPVAPSILPSGHNSSQHASTTTSPSSSPTIPFGQKFTSLFVEGNNNNAKDSQRNEDAPILFKEEDAQHLFKEEHNAQMNEPEVGEEVTYLFPISSSSTKISWSFVLWVTLGLVHVAVF